MIDFGRQGAELLSALDRAEKALDAMRSFVAKTYSWRCTACGAPLIGAQTLEGRVAPIDHKPVADGSIVLFNPPPHAVTAGTLQCRVLKGELLDGVRAEGIPLHTSHFETCPHADRFRHTPGAVAHTLTGEAA